VVKVLPEGIYLANEPGNKRSGNIYFFLNRGGGRMNIDLYALLQPEEKTLISETVGEALARAYGTDQLNNFDWDLTATKIEEE
tara:strand:+ start:112 stop:360 length:249 start_codon:yes stop_codon:yes gene_type:complete